MQVSDADLLDDLRRVSKAIGSDTIGMNVYASKGQYSESTIRKRFGTWNKALAKAQLSISNRVNISDDELFENILKIWQAKGKQPRRSDLANKPSVVSQSPYNRRFGGWTASLHAFIAWANESDAVPVRSDTGFAFPKQGPRDPSLRLRYRILKRDSFKCCACGRTPAVDPSCELHIDHIVPWSKGGPTIEENLQTLCEQCNLGKSNIE